jgi:hypothetical protein
VPAGLIPDQHVEASMVPCPGRRIAVARTRSAVVKAVAGSYVAIHHPDQAGRQLVILQ